MVRILSIACGFFTKLSPSEPRAPQTSDSSAVLKLGIQNIPAPILDFWLSCTIHNIGLLEFPTWYDEHFVVYCDPKTQDWVNEWFEPHCRRVPLFMIYFCVRWGFLREYLIMVTISRSDGSAGSQLGLISNADIDYSLREFGWSVRLYSYAKDRQWLGLYRRRNEGTHQKILL